MIDQPWGPPSLLYSGYRISFPQIKRLGVGVEHPQLPSAEVKERTILVFPLWVYATCSKANFNLYLLPQKSNQIEITYESLQDFQKGKTLVGR